MAVTHRTRAEVGASRRRIGAYVRISRDETGEAAGVTRQLQEIREACERGGWGEIVAVYVDNDRSAYSGKPRPEYLRMLADLRGGQLDDIGAWHGDRLHRSPRELEDFIDLINAAGASVHTVTGSKHDFTTSDGRTWARIEGTLARRESEHRSERVHSASVQRAQQGRGNGGMRPYGYRRLGGGVYEVIPEEASIIGEMAQRVLAGEAMHSLTRDLNRRDVATPAGGRRWGRFTMRHILMNPTTAGLRHRQGEVIGEAQWPAILDRETWERVQTVLGDPARRGDRKVPRSYLLSGGLAVCGLCRERLVGNLNGKDGRKQRRYRCDTPACRKVSMAADDVEEVVVEAAMTKFDELGVGERMRQRRADREPDTAAEREALERRIVQFEDMLVEGEWSREQFNRANAKAQARLAEIRTAEKTVAAERERATILDESTEPLRERWPGMTFDQRRTALALLIDWVEIGPGKPGFRRQLNRIWTQWSKIVREVEGR